MDKAAEVWHDLGELIEGTSPKVMARVITATGTLPTISQLSAITVRYWDVSQGRGSAATEVGTETTLTIADVWYDTAQGTATTEDGWDSTDGGYNFAYVIPTASIPGSAGLVKSYLVVFKITPVTGAVFYVRVQFTVTDQPGLGS